MIVNNNEYRKIHIEITTYKHKSNKLKTTENMNREKNTAKRLERANEGTKFICSICLNTKPKCDGVKKTDFNKRKSKSCPICQKGLDYRWEGLTEKLATDKEEVKEQTVKVIANYHTSSTKTVQTSQTDVTKGLNLLNEVLTVFQSKKQLCVEKDKYSKTILVKDACVETDNLKNSKKTNPKLTVSKMFHLAIEENSIIKNNKCTVVHCFQPQVKKNSQFSIDLLKHKSSSIPQMKLDELKNSLKEKSKSKDTIEEVNRMFATVRKKAAFDLFDSKNRPITRNGPRVLPVVKTKIYENNGENDIRFPVECKQEEEKVQEKNCKFCQTTNYLMSSGDSIIKPECCQQNFCDKMCIKCVHSMRCRKIHDGCEHCCQRCNENRRHHHGCYEENHDGDSCTSF